MFELLFKRLRTLIFLDTKRGMIDKSKDEGASYKSWERCTPFCGLYIWRMCLICVMAGQIFGVGMGDELQTWRPDGA